MAKKIVKQIKVQIVGGQATPAPPVGTSLGPHGINLGKFVAEFNERTRDIAGTVVPVIVTIFSASFKLSGSGETIFLTDTDANFNAVLDTITFGEQSSDVSYARTASDSDVWSTLTPTPGQPNP